MTVHLLAKNKLKITLDPAELQRLFGDYRRIDYSSPDTRSALGELLRQAVETADFELDCERVRIEVYPTPAGGCTIYFIKSDAPLRRTRYRSVGPAGRTLIFAFSGTTELLDVIAALYAEPALRALPSRLYRMADGYRLTLPATPALSTALPHLLEYGGRVLRRPVDAACTEEYGRLLQGGYAVRKIGALLAAARSASGSPGARRVSPAP